MNNTFKNIDAAPGFVKTYRVISDEEYIGRVSKTESGQWQAQTKRGAKVEGLVKTRTLAATIVVEAAQQAAADKVAGEAAATRVATTAFINEGSPVFPPIESIATDAEEETVPTSGYLDIAPGPDSSDSSDSSDSVCIPCYEGTSPATFQTRWERFKVWLRA